MNDSDQNPLITAYIERREELVRYFRVRLRSDEAAEDLVQEIYLKIAGRTEEDIGNPGAYLFRVGGNLLLDRLKQARRTGRREASWRDLNTSTAGGQEISEAAPADEVVDARQRLDRIIAAVNELPPPVREAFRLHKLEGLSHAETAKAMNISRSSVEKHIMASLKRILAKVGR